MPSSPRSSSETLEQHIPGAHLIECKAQSSEDIFVQVSSRHQKPEKKSGHIVNTSSIAGRKTFSGLDVYCANKYCDRLLGHHANGISAQFNIRVTRL
ncbi:hypothetical protein ACMV8I_14820 [Ewingella sp. S1.OA.A_B6]